MIQKFNRIVFLVLCLGFMGWMPALAQEATLELTGRVLSAADASPLPGISVSVPGVSAGMTGDDGTFKVKVPSYDVELTVSGPLYQAKRVALKGRKEIEIRMQAEGFDASVYKDVVTPMGEVNNSHLTASAVYLDKSRETEVGDMPENLLGTVAGLNVVERSGMEGSGANMFLRGFNSLYAGNQPLLVVDGMVMENAQFGESLMDGYISTPMGAINVKDIDRITVLKDASAIYGVKGANGAVLIQTKQVTDLTTHINVQALAGLSMQPQALPMLNVMDSKRYLAEMAQNAGLSSAQIQQLPFVNAEKPVLNNWGYSGNVDYYRYNQNTDWQDEIFQEAFKQQYSLDVSGGDEVAVYGLSLGFLSKDGVVVGNDYDRFNARINTAIKFTQNLRVKTNMSFIYGSKNLSNEGTASFVNPIYSALVKTPFTTAHVMNEQGLSSPKYEDVDYFGMANPSVVTNNVNSENSFYRFMGNIDLFAQLNKNLKFTTNFGVNFNKEREEVFYPKGGIPYGHFDNNVEITSNAQHRVERLFTLFDENRLTYTFDFAHDHKLDATLGFRYMTSRAENDFGETYNAPDNAYTSIGNGLIEYAATGGMLGKWNWLAAYANVNYNLYNKYFVDAVISADASSRYGEDVGTLQYYPSVTAAWLLSSEKWFRADFVDMLKFRAGYTQAGNDNIGNYAAKRYYVAQNFLGNYGLVRANLMNKDLKPERVTKLNVGLDMSFFDEAFTLSADFYKNTVTDMLVYSKAKYYTGLDSYIDNGGEMENVGIDVTATARLVNTKNVKWDLGITASHNQNEVTALKTGAFNTELAEGTIRTQVGSPLGIFYGYKTNGVYSTTADADADGLYTMVGSVRTPFEAGDVRFVDAHEDGLIDEKDMQEIGDPTPDLYGSIFTNLKVQRFNLSAQFKYSLGNDVYNYTRRNLETMSGWENQTEAVRNRWQVEGDITNMPKMVYGDPRGNARFSDRWIEDGSFLKLKNVTLSYNVPMHNDVLTDLVVYGAVENLFTITDYKGYDPEVISSAANPLNYGIDSYSTPHTTTFYVGVKAGL
ncbi:MAG: SusC/RagA family TonB-linked outer membrane protein [Bacteroidaceae bacterium]|nr:SusC/RagA family TonB-linked outer membrane protein [Bacteroidaceae bacterium]